MSDLISRQTTQNNRVNSNNALDTISREAAIDIPYKVWNEIDENNIDKFRDMVQSKIEQLPSAESEVIRCKDCKHYEIWQLKSDYTDDKRYKPSVCVVGRYAVRRSEDWFCADAERRTDEIN